MKEPSETDKYLKNLQKDSSVGYRTRNALEDALNVKSQIDRLLDRFPERLDSVVDESTFRMQKNYQPKLTLAEEKVVNLENLIELHKEENQNHETLKLLDEQIEKFTITKNQLSKKVDEYHELGSEYRGKSRKLQL